MLINVHETPMKPPLGMALEQYQVPRKHCIRKRIKPNKYSVYITFLVPMYMHSLRIQKTK